MKVHKKYILTGLIGILIGGGLFYVGVEFIAPKIQEITNDYVEVEVEDEEIERNYDIEIVTETIDKLKEHLLNPSALKVNSVIMDKSTGFTILVDYSAMNKMGGYVRDYATYNPLNYSPELSVFIPNNMEESYRETETKLKEGEEKIYYFDMEPLKDNF